jgi:O-succinylbenzoate synthase
MIKVERLELRHIRMQLQSPFRTSFGEELGREALILCAFSDGAEGWGECVASRIPGYSYETVGTAWHVLAEFFIPELLREEIDGPAGLQSRLREYRGHPFARAGLEMALWDIQGKVEGQSLAEMLGGDRTAVPVGVSIGIQADEAALLDAVRGYLRKGYGRVKLKIAPGNDLAPVRAVREAYPDLPLQVDANSAYQRADAQVFQKMDEFGLLMIEQPLSQDDLVDHAELQSKLKTPICLDESIRTPRHARQALDLGAARIINIKPARVSGLNQAVAVHDLCHQREVPVWCGGMLETGIGRAANLALASLPGFSLPGDISATQRYYGRDIALPEFVLQPDSTITVPEGAGLGVEVDRDYLDHVTLRSQDFA